MNELCKWTLNEHIPESVEEKVDFNTQILTKRLGKRHGVNMSFYGYTQVFPVTGLFSRDCVNNSLRTSSHGSHHTTEYPFSDFLLRFVAWSSYYFLFVVFTS